MLRSENRVNYEHLDPVLGPSVHLRASASLGEALGRMCFFGCSPTLQCHCNDND